MNYGFIGLGNMASAILRGMKESGNYENCTIYGFNRSSGKTLALAETCSIIPVQSAFEAADKADIIVLGVKPQMLDEVLPQISAAVRPGKLVISMAAGKSLDYYAGFFGKNAAVVRVMPNINAKVGLAVTAICGSETVTGEMTALAEAMFRAIGQVFTIPEKLFSGFNAMGGASVAFACTYIDALAKAGVKAGFSKPQALEIAAGATLGTAQLILRGGEHPLALIDQVCSPGGTTIEGVMALQEAGFESAIHKAAQAVIDKDKKL